MREDAQGGGEVRAVADLVELAGQFPPSHVVVAGGDRPEDLRLVESARDHGIIERIVLVGQQERIAQAVEAVGIDVPPADIVGREDDDAVAAAVAELVRAGAVGMVLKGNISTPVINRHLLPLAERATVSLATAFDAAPFSGGRPMVLTDAGVTTVCNFGRMLGLIDNAVDVARTVLGIQRPRVAILSANEKQIPSLASTQLAKALTEAGREDAVVYGPLSLDLATDPGSVAVKGLPDTPAAQQVAGQADVLVCPGIDAANVLYKAITALVKYGEASMAGITVGFPVPYIILSRADALDTRLQSIALCGIYQQRQKPAASRRKGQPSIPAPSAGKVHRMLVVNPGSTSLKLALFENETPAAAVETPYCLPAASTRAEREAAIEALADKTAAFLAEADRGEVDAIAARGGFVPRPPAGLASGVYVVAEHADGGFWVDEATVTAVRDAPEAEHASNLGIPVGAALARRLGVPAYTVDPVVVDELAPEAAVSGFAPVARRSTAHVLSLKEAARQAARRIGRPVEALSFVAAHLGGGITVAAVRGGRLTDTSIALLGGGPFTPHRAGQLPTGALIDLCYSGAYTRDELVYALTREGGLQSYLGVGKMDEIEARIDQGDAEAAAVVDAMVYQISKEIGAMYVAAGNDVAAIVLTGGLTRSRLVRDGVRRRIGRLAPVLVFEASLEMNALAEGVLGVLRGATAARRFETAAD